MGGSRIPIFLECAYEGPWLGQQVREPRGLRCARHSSRWAWEWDGSLYDGAFVTVEGGAPGSGGGWGERAQSRPF